jgi:hypothetical protein
VSYFISVHFLLSGSVSYSKVVGVWTRLVSILSEVQQKCMSEHDSLTLFMSRAYKGFLAKDKMFKDKYGPNLA